MTYGLQVADRGYGMVEDELAYVFDRFYRADRSKPRVRKVDGAGLGLPIAKTVVEAHGRRISAARRPGGGTCVWKSACRCSSPPPSHSCTRDAMLQFVSLTEGTY